MQHSEKKRTVKEIYESIDINYVNHNVMMGSKSPAYSLFFYMGAIVLPITVMNFRLFIISLVIAIVMSHIAKKLQQSNQDFGYFFSMIKYIFKPSFFLLKKNPKIKEN